MYICRCIYLCVLAHTHTHTQLFFFNYIDSLLKIVVYIFLLDTSTKPYYRHSCRHYSVCVCAFYLVLVIGLQPSWVTASKGVVKSIPVLIFKTWLLFYWSLFAKPSSYRNINKLISFVSVWRKNTASIYKIHSQTIHCSLVSQRLLQKTLAQRVIQWDWNWNYG